MSEPQIEARGHGEVGVSGELTFATVMGLHGKAVPLFEKQAGDFVIDLAAVSRADSAGLALLIEWLRWAQRRGVTIAFRAMPGQLRAIAAASDLDGLLPLSS
jgi:phospholipid transport system transporter-binding protein